MPAKNTVKVYVENAIYHVYNRGVEKRTIFLDQHDYGMFLHFLKYYLGEPEKTDLLQKKRSLRGEIRLLAFCLMPNHYHLLLRQLTRDGMTKLIRAVCTSYSGYFNNRYARVGGLFQGKYKAALVEEESYFIHVSGYIHRNPWELSRVGPLKGSDPFQEYPYSSYSYYLGLKKADWLDTSEILGYFHSAQKTWLKDIFSYQSFVEDYFTDANGILGNLALE